MRKNLSALCIICIAAMLVFSQCTQSGANKEPVPAEPTVKEDFGGYESQVKWGEHIVTIAACHDCHTPKIMNEHGFELDSSRLLSGHPADMPAEPGANRKELENKVLVASMDLTTWAGPWGVSYTANLTPDETGLGNWKEEQFIYALREGRFKGLPASRPLLPPMPWQMYKNMSDEELKAVFAYLRSIKPISNVVPPALPPTSVSK